MKKVFLFFLCALTICTLFIMPAMATSNNYVYDFLEHDSVEVEQFPSAGTYVLSFEFSGNEFDDFISEPINILDFGSGEDFYFVYKGSERWYRMSFEGSDDCWMIFFDSLFDDYSNAFSNLNGVRVTLIPVTSGSDVQDSAAGASIWDVFTGVGNYISESLSSATALFYNAETATLTPVGTLSLVAVAVGLAILIVALLRNYLHLG